MKKVAVIGAGISGLFIANLFKRNKKYQVTIFERNSLINSKKGYGFITLEEENQKDVFLHVSALEKSKFRVLKENQIIQFEIKEERGKLQAINLKRPKK